MKDLLTIVGGLTLFVIGWFAIICALSGIMELIRKLRRKRQIKNRFKKPPTAKCYCVDCVYHDSETKQCYRFGETTKEYRCTADNCFCWEAEPRTRDVNKEES